MKTNSAPGIKPKKGGLRAIDKGTDYDVTGSLRRLIRVLESDKYGRPRACLITVVCGTGTERSLIHDAHGVTSFEEQQMMSRRMMLWLDRRSME